ncbi:acyclic terpene utilization AtuA family protein [Clostridium sp. JNZ X4-2]
MKKIRIGSGAGFAGDRIEPALEILKKGNIDYIIFECLAERTIAINQQQKLFNGDKGYNEFLEHRMRKILPLCVEKGVKVITNMGSANPAAAIKVIKEIALDMGIRGMKIAAVLGDDILDRIDRYMNCEVLENGKKLDSINSQIVSANAYTGVKGIVEALNNGSHIVVTGRTADPSLVLAPLMFEFGWRKNDYELLGKGTLAGHLLECAGQITGGYFADPGYKDVPELWNLGFPIAEVTENGNIIITKLEDSGGMITEHTCKEQILYEIHDPSNYFTPDVIADFSEVAVEEIEKNKVLVKGASGKEKSGLFKVSIGYKDCYIGEGEISYGGSGAYDRARLAGEIVRKRLKYINLPVKELRIDFMGVNSLYGNNLSSILNDNKVDFKEVRLRVAARTLNREDAETIGNEVEALYTNGPSGGGGARKYTRDVVSIASIFVPDKDIITKVIYKEV